LKQKKPKQSKGKRQEIKLTEVESVFPIDPQIDGDQIQANCSSPEIFRPAR
jgi:hypothetical protein